MDRGLHVPKLAEVEVRKHELVPLFDNQQVQEVNVLEETNKNDLVDLNGNN